MADIKQVGLWMENIKPEQKIRRPDWSKYRFIYLHIFSDKTTGVGMCTMPAQTEWKKIELLKEDINANDWQLIEE